MTKRLIILTLAIATLLIQGCGFHLRGQYNYSPALNPLYIESSDKDLKFELADVLEFGSIVIAETPENANSVLNFIEEVYTRDPVSLDDRGRATRYNLRYKVVFNVVNREGDILLEESTSSSFQVLDYDQNAQLQAEEEEIALREVMYEDISQSIARRLSKVTGEIVAKAPNKQVEAAE